MKTTLIISAFVVVAGSVAVHAADDAAFQASLTPSVALQSSSTQIDGLSLSIWGENPQRGVALGFLNGSTDDSKGFTWGLYNYDESYTGVQLGVVNYSSTSFIGLQYSMVNWDQGYFKGLEWGLVNVSQETHGVQLGTFNYAEQLSGIQVGLINIAANNDWFTGFPDQLAKGFVFVNWSF
jgi:hypothetical protein